MKKFFMLFVLMVMVLNYSMFTFASDTTLHKENLGEEKFNDFIDGLHFFVVDSEPVSILTCIDISDDNIIALASGNGSESLISFYDSVGAFKYSLSFYSAGNFGLEWEKDNIKIFFERGDYEVTINKAGEVLDIAVIDNVDDMRFIVDELYFSTKSVVNNTVYELKKNPMFLNKLSSGYSQLLITDVSGNTSVVCDVGEFQAFETLCIIIVFVLLFGINVFFVLKRPFFKKQ